MQFVSGVFGVHLAGLLHLLDCIVQFYNLFNDLIMGVNLKFERELCVWFRLLLLWSFTLFLLA